MIPTYLNTLTDGVQAIEPDFRLAQIQDTGEIEFLLDSPILRALCPIDYTRQQQDPIMQNREAWLTSAVDLLNPLVLAATAAKVPEVRVSVGFPSTRALSTKSRRIGECWHGETIKPGIANIFVSPVIDDTIEVLGTVLHEMVHATLPPKTGHKAPFAKAVKAIGLEGKPTHTTVGESLANRLNADVVPVLGPYPHQAFDGFAGRKKQTTRLRLYQCECPVKVRVASDEFSATCNVCEQEFQVKEKNDND